MLIDSHCHIPSKDYEISIENLVAEAKENDVLKMITVGTSLEDSLNTVETALDYDCLYPSVGVYPHENMELELSGIKKRLMDIIVSHKNEIVAIGEAGIDIVSNATYKTRKTDDQIELFKEQINISLDFDLPLIVHNRNADDLILRVFNDYGSSSFKGVFHCFTSNWEFAQRIMDLGFYISFSGIITFHSAGEYLLDVVKNTPNNKFMIETDSPLLAPQGYRGKINYPKYVKITAEKVADIKGISFSDASEYSYQNTCKLFNICNTKPL